MPTKSRTRTEYSLQAPVRVLSTDLKMFDRPGGAQRSQKTKFQISFHSRLCRDLILSPTRQDPNLSSNEYRSVIWSPSSWRRKDIKFSTMPVRIVYLQYLSETLDVLKRLVETELHQNQNHMMPSRVDADGCYRRITTKEKESRNMDEQIAGFQFNPSRHLVWSE